MNCNDVVNIVDYKRIGQRIRTQRKEKGLSQEQLAELIGISLSFMGHIERGTRKASVETLARISKALKMDMSPCFRLWNESNERNQPAYQPTEYSRMKRAVGHGSFCGYYNIALTYSKAGIIVYTEEILL